MAFTNSYREIKLLLKQNKYREAAGSEYFFEVATKLMLSILALLIPLMSFDFGITWDERMSIQYSRDMMRYFATMGRDKTCLDLSIPLYSHMIYYGNVFGLITSSLHKILPLDIIVIRHVLCSFFGFLTVFYISRQARLIKGYGLALLTIILLVFSPRFFGYIMNDFRDTTFMLGVVASCYYFDHVRRRLPNWSWFIAFKAAAAVFLASSVRIGGMILIPIFLIVLLLGLWEHKKQWKQYAINAAITLAYISIISYVLVVSFWPWAHENILIRPFQAVLKFSDLRLLLNYQLFKGSLIPNFQVPWDYLFTWIGITSPLVVLLGLFFSVLVIFRKTTSGPNDLMLPILAVVIPLLAYLIGVRNLYDGWRHFLFLAPYMALFAAIGWVGILGQFKKDLAKKVVLLVMTTMLFLPLKSMVLNHPFHTLYFNEIIGGIKGAYGAFELDMDGNSLRNAAEWFNEYAEKNHIEGIKLASNHEGLSISHYLAPNITQGSIIWLPLDHTFLKDWDYAVLSSRTMSKYQILSGQWPYKESIHEIVVDGVPVLSILKRVDKNLFLGKIAMDRGDLDGAVRHFLDAKKFNPKQEDNYRLLGVAYMQAGEYDRAEKAFNSAVRLNPTNVSLLYYIGELAYNKGEFDRALDYLKRAKEVRLDNYRSDYLIASIYTRQGKFDAAFNHYRSLIDSKNINASDLSLIYTGFGELHMFMAQNESDRRQKELVNKAISMFEKGVNLNPKNRMAYANLIEVYRLIENPEAAEQTQRIMEANINQGQ
ncbi:MAG: tetratricopeptide repeat protein [Vicingaceae bacterium]